MDNLYLGGMKKIIAIIMVIAAVISVTCAGVFIYYKSQDTQSGSNGDGVDAEKCISIYENLSDTIQAIEEKYLDEDGYVLEESENDLMEEIYEYAPNLLSGKQLTSTSYNPDNGASCIYMEIAHWLDVVYMPPKKDVMSGGESKSTIEIFAFESSAAEMRLYIELFAETSKIFSYKYPMGDANMITNEFPFFSYSNAYKDEEVTLESLQTIQSNSVILWEGHGGYSEEMVSFLVIVTKKYDQTTIRFYWKELGDKALCMNTKGQFYITAKYIEDYMSDHCFEGSLIYLASCYSMKNVSDNPLINAIWDKGARAVLGTTGKIGIFYNIHMMDAFVDGLCSRNDAGEYRTIVQALEYAKEKYGEGDFWGPEGAIIIMKYRDDFTLEDMSKKGTERQSSGDMVADDDSLNNIEDIQEGLYIEPDTQNILYVEQNEDEISFTAWWSQLASIEETAKLNGNDAEFVCGEECTRQTSEKLHFENDKAILTLDDNRLPNLNKQTEYVWLRDSMWELSEKQLKEIRKNLGVPEDMDVQYKQYKPYYESSMGCYLTDVQVLYNGEVVATALVNSFTGELVRNIWMYSDWNTSNKNIPDGAIEKDGHSYFIFDVDDVTSGQAAADFCKNRGGYLPAITSE